MIETVCFAVGIALFMFAVLQQGRVSAWNMCFATVAKSYRARHMKGTLFRSSPKIQVRRQNDHYVVDYCHDFENGHCTRLVGPWENRTLRLEIWTLNFWSPSRDMRQRSRARIGSRQFAAEFAVASNNLALAEALVSPAVQRHLIVLRDLFEFPAGLRVSIERGQLIIFREGRLTKAPDLKRFVDFGLELFRLAKGWQLASRDEIQIVSETVEPPAETPSTCPICGEAIEARPVQCRSCRTLHHRDCWDYNGMCAMYGCGEARARDPHRKVRKDRLRNMDRKLRPREE